MDTVILYRDSKGRYRWRREDADGKVIRRQGRKSGWKRHEPALRDLAREATKDPADTFDETEGDRLA